MRSFDYRPLYRSTVGFDRLLDMLDTSVRSDWPPYNIEKKSDNDYRITMAIAGFSPDEVELTQDGPELIVTGQKRPSQENRQILHQGLAIGEWPAVGRSGAGDSRGVEASPDRHRFDAQRPIGGRQRQDEADQPKYGAAAQSCLSPSTKPKPCDLPPDLSGCHELRRNGDD